MAFISEDVNMEIDFTEEADEGPVSDRWVDAQTTSVLALLVHEANQSKSSRQIVVPAEIFTQALPRYVTLLTYVFGDCAG